MFLEFCNNLSPACEPSARVRDEGHDCIGYRFVAKDVIVVDLQEIHAVNSFHNNGTASRTVPAALIVPPLTTGL